MNAPRLLNRRGFLLGATAAGSTLATGARADATTVLTVAGFAGPFQSIFRTVVMDTFERKRPDVRVVYRPAMNSAQMLAMLRLERQAPQIDVAITDISISFLATAENLLAPLAEQAMPSLAAIPPWGRPEGMYGVAFSTDNLTLLYDTRALKSPPGSWLDLARPDLADQICLPVEDTRGVVLLPLLTRMQGGDYRRSIEPGLAVMRRFAPLVATWNAQPDIYTLLLAGTVALGVGWNGRARMIAQANPGMLSAVIPREGSVAQINTLNLTARAPQGELAQAFIDHALSVDVQAAFAERAYYGPVNNHVVLPEALKSAISGPPEAAARAMQLDWRFVSAHYSEWVRRIQREVISG
ncbi:extracellular solute-binding protein [Acetobacter garciniae]|nr:extracellular solute-binding protein [Acetobacter garciniae]